MPTWGYPGLVIVLVGRENFGVIFGGHEGGRKCKPDEILNVCSDSFFLAWTFLSVKIAI